ncbi:MAG TPA: L-ribulose-5-phosphate 4-epimerase AraD [Flavitalea sp.]|nr:L-ribulose-5-phosphate 4-epimerase AraD [Flavitalea sp.]
MSKFSKIKQQAFDGNMQLPKLGLVLFTFGNVSVADHEARVFAIKPSGVAYEDLTIEKMVIVDFEGNIIEGKLRPSSDTKTHAVLYAQCGEMAAIVHTHSTYATAWAQALRDIPNYGTTHADHTVSDIPCAPQMNDIMIRGDYEYETGFQILNCLKERNLSYKETEMILVGSHAPFAWGKSVEKAVYNAAVLEELARMALFTEQLNPAVKRLKESLVNKHFERKHGKGAYYGQ